MNARATSVEPLEDRIAPAAVITFPDVDGDVVKIVSSKGTKFDLMNAAHVVGGQLQLLDLTAATFGGEFDRADITITATPGASGGDGLVNVGRIDATGNDLGAISISGDLGKVVCGTNSSRHPAIKSLAVRSMGIFGTATQGAGSNLVSQILGDLGALTVKGDFAGVSFTTFGKVGAIKVGGDLRGGDTIGAGRIIADAITSVNIGGDVIAGLGDETGKITSNGPVGQLTIGGSLVGALDAVTDVSGQIFVGGKAGPISIGKDIVGAVSEQKAIELHSDASAISVGGSILAGAGKYSGSIYVNGKAGALKIGRDVQAGAGDFSGRILVSGTIAGFTVGRDVRGGSGSEFDAPLVRQVAFSGSTGPVKIGGDVVGGTGLGSAIVDLGGGAPSLTVGGSLIGGGGLLAGFGGIGGGGITAGNTPSISIGGSLVGSSFNGGSLLVISTSKLTIKGSLVGANHIDSISPSLQFLQVLGNLGSATIGGSVVGPGLGNGTGNPTIDIGGNATSLSIAGGIVGGASPSSGKINIAGNAGAVKIGGSLVPGAGNASGNLNVGGRLAMLQIGDTVQAAVTAASFGAVKITGNVPGDIAALTGGFDSITIAGSLIADVFGGTVTSNGSLGTVKIGGSIYGSSGGGAQNLKGKSAGNITIGGDIVGRGATFAAVIDIAGAAGAITINGDVRGPASTITRLLFDTGFSPTRGFASFTVKGSVANVFIGGGLSFFFSPVQSDATLGPVRVGGDWTASSISAGISRGADMLFGTSDDGPTPASKIARIALITIAGQVLGTAGAGDHFGFVSRNIGPVKIGGASYTPGATAIELSPLSDDVTIRVV